MKIKLFQLIITIGFIWSLNPVLAQADWQLQVGDEWFNKNQGLKVGDKMPDLSLGEVINNYSGLTKFSDLRGKLIILDMWSTKCSSCIAFFPEMEKIQKEFKKDIQIIAVNPYETKQQIDNAFAIRNRNKTTSKKAQLPNLPCIVNAKELYSLFPARFVPHHIWIDQNGVIAAIGPELITYRKKIEDFLRGGKVSFMKDNNTTPLFNKNVPYHVLTKRNVDYKRYNSFFTPYNFDYNAKSDARIIDVVDSINGTIRSTWINTTATDLFLAAFQQLRDSLIQRTIFSSFNYSLPIEFITIDTGKYTDGFIPVIANNFKLTDTDFIRCRFCYEQIAPFTMLKEERVTQMLNDLNKYFGNLYGASISVEKRRITCFSVVQTSSNKQTKSRPIADLSSQKFVPTGKTQLRIIHEKIKGALQYVVDENIFKQEILNQPILLLDETNNENYFDMVLPQRSDISNIEELRKAIRPYNLDVVKTTREVPFIVIKDYK